MTGCTQVSPGCDNCYAMELAERYRGTKAWPVGFDLQLRPHKLRLPVGWRVPSFIFVNSMSDLFHKNIPDEYLRRIWDVMLEADWHIYQVLTKRAHRMWHKITQLGLPTPPHVWLGVSVESQAMAASRLPPLLEIDCNVRWVSAEPLLEPVDLSQWIDWLDWCVVGGESGAKRRPFDKDWARLLRDQCFEAGTPYFFKQGSALRPDSDKLLDGVQWNQYPGEPSESLTTRQMQLV